MTFTCDDLGTLASLVADAWRSGADRDWSARAGDLEWSCTRTADHAIDTVLAPAFFLASRRSDDHPAYDWDAGTVDRTAGASPERTSRYVAQVSVS